jgi:hypothetical protein
MNPSECASLTLYQQLEAKERLKHQGILILNHFVK